MDVQGTTNGDHLEISPAPATEPPSRRDVSRNSRISNVTTASSCGVQRMQAVAHELTSRDKWRIFSSLFLFAFAYSLDNSLRDNYEARKCLRFSDGLGVLTFNKAYSLANLGGNDITAVASVIRAVVGAATYFVVAKVSDAFGRLELVFVSVVFYVVGTIIDATCRDAAGFYSATVIYQIGYTSILLLMEVIVADLTSMRHRLIVSTIALWPNLLNIWINQDIKQAVLRGTDWRWRWGIGMWACIVAVASLPLMISLWIPYRRASSTVRQYDGANEASGFDMRKILVQLVRELDVIGIVLLFSVFALVLVPFTVAGNSLQLNEQWRRSSILVPTVIGAVCFLPVWIVWEWKGTSSPLLPAEVLKRRTVWGALGTSCLVSLCSAVQSKFLYTVLTVAFGEHMLSANRITSLSSFTSVSSSTLLGLAVLHCRRLKAYIVAGVVLVATAFGLLVRFKGAGHGQDRIGMIAGQALLGLAWGMILEPAKALIQSDSPHEHVAAVTGLYMATSSLGTAIGNAVAGAIWTQTVVPTLISKLSKLSISGNVEQLAMRIYTTPTRLKQPYQVRMAVAESYSHTQMLLMITTLCLCVPLIVASLCLRNIEMDDKQNDFPINAEGLSQDQNSEDIENHAKIG